MKSLFTVVISLTTFFLQAQTQIGSNSESFTTNSDFSGLYTEATGTPDNYFWNGSLAFADIDGDNDQDVWISGSTIGAPIALLYSNNGNGVFSNYGWPPFDSFEDSSVAFADIDGDNDPDKLIIGLNSSGQAIAKLSINDGSGHFSVVTGTPFDGVSKGSIAFADVDGDNDQDVLITGENSSNQEISKLYINNGSGGFTVATGTPFDGVRYSSIAFADVDGDNDQDVMITGWNNSGQPMTKLYTNNGSGIFSEATGTPFDDILDGSIAFADVDGDNDQDVLITGRNSSSQRIAKLYINNGNGVFSEATGTAFDGVEAGSIAFADVDEDTDQDVLITGYNNSDQGIAKLYINNGSGIFSEATGTPFVGIFHSSIGFADVDGDNDQDVLITGADNSSMVITKLYTNTTFTPCFLATNLSVDNITSNSADLSWDAASTETGGYEYVLITNGTIPDETTTPTGSVGTGVTFVNLTGLTGIAYSAYVRTNCGNGKISGWSEAVSFNTVIDYADLYTEVTGTPFEGVNESSIAFADVDGDMDQDVLITGRNSSSQRIAKLYMNNGSGGFSLATGMPFEGVSSGSIGFADVDGDNDQDVLITGWDSSDQRIAKLYINNGNGVYSEVTGTPFDGVYNSSIAFADVDGDNDQDVLITGDNNFNQYIAKLYINNGNGGFSELTGTPFDGVRLGSVAFADVDGDTDQDVLITGAISSGQAITKLYFNNGSGVFTEATGTPFEDAHSGSIAFADVDGDMDQDVLITGIIGWPTQWIAKLYINNGSGDFTEATNTPFEGVSRGSIAFADVDGDTDQDVLITGDHASQNISKLYINNGIGVFSEATGTPFEGVENGSIAFADVDGDTDQDVLITGWYSIAKLYSNSTFADCFAPTNLSATNITTTTTDLSWDAAATEAGGYEYVLYTDGTIPDAATIPTGSVGTGVTSVNLTGLITGTAYTVYVRTICGDTMLSGWSVAVSYTTFIDLTGLYTEETATPFDGVRVGSTAFADVDGDTDQDVLITGINSSSQRIAKLYANNGNGVFSEANGTPFEGVSDSSIAFADVDGDTDQDVLITGYGSSNQIIAKLYINNGSGGFSEVTGTPFEGVQNSSIAFADVDGDNDQDVLITGRNSSGQPITKLYINNGIGVFSEATGTPFEGVQNSSIAFADVDGDNDQDVLITGYNSSYQPITKLYTNNGNGVFSEATGTPFEAVRNSSIAFADVDGDNDQDVLITGYNGSNQPIAKLYTNNGIGVFSEATGTPFEGVGSSSIAFADVDGDMDQDVLITGWNNSDQPIAKLYTNNGSGGFNLAIGLPFEGVWYSSIAFADIDGDTDQDVLITGLNSSDQSISKLYTNNTFTPCYLATNLSVTNITNNSADLSWDAAATEAGGYEYVLFTDGTIPDGTTTPTGSVETGITSVSLTGLSTGTAYTAYVRTNCGNGMISGWSAAISFSTTIDLTGLYTEVSGTIFDEVSNSSIAFADVDGDNDQDVLITGYNGSNQPIAKLYTNNGIGVFSESTGTPFEGVISSSIAFADVNGDNYQDVLITGYNSSYQPITKLYTNNGNGVFSEATGTPFEAVRNSSIAFADVDGDNDQDVLITGYNGSNQPIAKLYTNNGIGVFSEATGTPFEGVGSSSIAFADVDGDMDQDVLITGYNSVFQPKSKLYINNGSGDFSEVTGTPFEGVTQASIAFSDVDGDNDQDVLITGYNSSIGKIAKLYINNGSGGFSEATGSPFDGVSISSIAFTDVDGDTDQDVLITGSSSDQRIAKLYINNGSGVFSEASGTPFEGVLGSSITFTDVDGDTDQDVLITGENDSYQRVTKLYSNSTFADCFAPTNLSATNITTTTADLTWDPAPNENSGYDYVLFTDGTIPDGTTTPTGSIGTGVTSLSLTGLLTGTAYTVYVRTNCENGLTSDWSLALRFSTTIDLSGLYTEETGTPFEGVGYGSIAYADVDGDTDQDVLITGYNIIYQPISKLYNNKGNGVFSEAAGTPFEGVRDSSIAFADVDGDTDQDVLITGYGSSNQIIAKLYINNGSGGFSEANGTPFEGVYRSSIAFADVDGDADQDVLITGYNSFDQHIAKLYINNGSGVFSLVTGTPFDGVQASSVAFADVDEDADQDVLITGYNSSAQRITKLYTNNGNGGFSEATATPFYGVQNGSIAFADVDGDNDQDVLITGIYGSGQYIAKLYTNNGSGVFSQASGTPFDGVYRGSIAFADVDGDADQDVLITGYNSSAQRIAKLYINNGSGIFSQATGPPFEGVYNGSIAFTDLDGDNDQDVLITGSNSSSQNITKLYTNNTFAPCFAPTNLSASNITISTADLSWDTDATATSGYEYVLFTDDTIPDENTIPTGSTSSNSITLTDIFSETTYVFYVRSNCVYNNLSPWSPALNFETEAIIETALDFDGLDDYIVSDASAPSILPKNNEIRSVEFSVNTIQNDTGVVVSWGKRDSGAPDSEAKMSAFGIKNGKAAFFGELLEVTGTVSLNDGQWHDVAITYDGTNVNNMKIYVDGILDSGIYDVTSQSGSLILDTDTSSVDHKLIIGATPPPSSATNFLVGTIDNLRIWNISLSETEVSSYAGVEIPANTSGLVAYFDFQDGTSVAGTTSLMPNNFIIAEDLTGNYDGTLTNFSQSGNSSNWVLRDIIYWTGAENKLWNNTNNWRDFSVPGSDDHAIIQNVLNKPLISESQKVELNTLEISENANLEIIGTLKISRLIINEGEIIFKSNASSTGQFDEYYGTISGSGQVMAERFIPAKRAFRLLSSPVTTSEFIYENWQENGSTPETPDGLGTHITGGLAASGFDQSGSNNPSMFIFDNSNTNETSEQIDDWEPLSNTNATKLRAGEAYLTMVRGDRSIDLTNSSSSPTVTTLRSRGEMFAGTLSYSAGNSLSYLNLNDIDNFYNLITNPYQAVVDFDAVTKTGLTDFMYVWDASIAGTNGRGGYVTVELPLGSTTEGTPPSPTSSDANQYLAPGMSFFVQNDDNASTSTSIIFEEEDKATEENQVTVFSIYTNFYINSRLYKAINLQNGDTESDAIGLRFSNNYTTTGNNDEDATKLFNPGENYAVVNNGLRSIDKQALPIDLHEIELSILNYTESNYSLTFELQNKPENTTAYLTDTYLNTQTEILNGTTYDYTVDISLPESIASDRFRIIFDNTTLGVNNNNFGSNFILYPNPTIDGCFNIRTQGLSGVDIKIRIHNIFGQLVHSKKLKVENNGDVNVEASGLSAGVYVVELLENKKSFIAKLIVK